MSPTFKSREQSGSVAKLCVTEPLFVFYFQLFIYFVTDITTKKWRLSDNLTKARKMKQSKHNDSNNITN